MFISLTYQIEPGWFFWLLNISSLYPLERSTCTSCIYKREERYAQLRKVKRQFESFHNELSTFHLEFYWFICRSTFSRRGWWFLEECRQNSHRISFQEEDKNNTALDWKCVQILLAISLWKTILLQKEQRKNYFHTEMRKRKEEGRKIPELDV